MKLSMNLYAKQRNTIGHHNLINLDLEGMNIKIMGVMNIIKNKN